MAWILLAALAVLAAAAYARSLWVHPWIRCRPCKGSGRTRDRIWRGAYGSCPKCGGRGRKPRLGIRVAMRARARQMLAAKGAHKKADRRGR